VILAVAEDQPQELGTVVGGGMRSNQLRDAPRPSASIDRSVGGADCDARDDTYGPVASVA
jgi:hypothetical protein